MVKVTYVEHDGTEHVADVPVGLSLMKGAVENGIPGILADCGGACACGTCRVFVVEAFRAVTGEPHDMEDAMLEIDDDPRPGKRLSCQIPVTEAMDGLVVHMPEKQF
jgi:ferredoxin, 2Fe-2S